MRHRTKVSNNGKVGVLSLGTVNETLVLAPPCRDRLLLSTSKWDDKCRVETSATHPSAIWENVRVLLVSIWSSMLLLLLLLLPTNVQNQSARDRFVAYGGEYEKSHPNHVYERVLIYKYCHYVQRGGDCASRRTTTRTMASHDASSSSPPTIGGRQRFSVKRSTIVAGHVKQYSTVLISKVQVLLVRRQGQAGRFVRVGR